MKQFKLCACIGASLVSIAALAACSSMRTAAHPAAPATAPPKVELEIPPPPPADSAAIESNVDVRPNDTAAVPPTCSCAEIKPKPKPKPKLKPVHKEAPPQTPTAPVVAGVPPGDVVDAQVRPMSVSVMSILGKKVEGAKGEDMGRVVDVLADASGRVRIAIIDFGGFLGVGDRRIAVDWPLLRFNPDGRDPSLVLSLSRDKLKNAPEYKDDPRPQTLMEPPAPATAPAVAPAEGTK